MEPDSPHRQSNKLSLSQLFRGRIRVILLGLILTALTFALGIRLINTISIKGVVNAPILLIQSPIDGTVFNDQVKAGDTISKGADLFTIVNNRFDRSNLNHVSSQLGQIKAVINGLTRRVEHYETLEKELLARLSAHLETNGDYLKRQQAEIQGQLTKAIAAAAQAERDRMRQQGLAAKGIDSQQQMEQAELEFKKAAQDQETLQASLDRIQTEIDASLQGILLDGYSGAPYAQQRLDELTLRLSEARSELEQARSKERVLTLQLEEEHQVVESLTKAVITAPALSLVQSVRVGNEAYVLKGTVLCELIDVSRSYVEATIPEKKFDSVSLGDKAEIFLYGSQKSIPGIVTAVRGAGAYNASNSEIFAAKVAKTTPDSMLVSISIDISDLIKTYGSANQVGRTARVRLEK